MIRYFCKIVVKCIVIQYIFQVMCVRVQGGGEFGIRKRYRGNDLVGDLEIQECRVLSWWGFGLFMVFRWDLVCLGCFSGGLGFLFLVFWVSCFWFLSGVIVRVMFLGGQRRLSRCRGGFVRGWEFGRAWCFFYQFRVFVVSFLEEEQVVYRYQDNVFQFSNVNVLFFFLCD